MNLKITFLVFFLTFSFISIAQETSVGNYDDAEDLFDGINLQNSPILWNYAYSGAQILYTADELTEINGKDITEVRFKYHITGCYVEYASQLKVYISEIDEAAFPYNQEKKRYEFVKVSHLAPNDTQELYIDFSGFSEEDNELIIDLSKSPYHYNGKNLVITLASDAADYYIDDSWNTNPSFYCYYPKDTYRTLVYGSFNEEFTDDQQISAKYQDSPAAKFTYKKGAETGHITTPSGQTYNLEELTPGQLASEPYVKVDGTVTEENIAKLCSAISTENPNCLVYLPEGTEVGSNAANFILGNEAQSITLDDKKTFHCPTEFIARNIVYTRDFSKTSGKDGNAAGWETIVLPFTVGSFTSKGETIVPFGMSGGKNFWLRSLDSAGFARATELKANTPYIICMPNNPAYSEKYNITGEVTFSATDVTIGITPEFDATCGKDFDMMPAYTLAEMCNEVYVIDDEGCSFIRNSKDAHPFHPYVTAPAGTDKAKAPVKYSIDGEGGTTNLEESFADQDLLLIYPLNGNLMIDASAPRMVEIHSIDGRLIRRAWLNEGVNAIPGFAHGIYMVGGIKVFVD